VAARVRSLGVVALAGAILVAGCGVDGRVSTPAPPTPSPAPTLSPAVGPTIAAVTQALGAFGLGVESAQRPYRPGESPELAAAPRWTLQVELRDEPDHGFITIYDLADVRAAERAADAQATYIASGPGRVQFPTDAEFSIRRVGQTVVFYSWSPGSAADPRAGEVIEALGTVGVGVPVPG
jgi:hypothetical protein